MRVSQAKINMSKDIMSFMQFVQGDRIFDSETGKEVMWRGAGGSYFLHATTLAEALNAWQSVYLPHAINFGFNTMRLAFSFPWEVKTDKDGKKLATADVFDFAHIDPIIDLLAQHGIKSILDFHGSQIEMFRDDVGGPVNPNLISSWKDIATHYKNNENVVAYQLYNEPAPSWGATWRHSKRENAQGYHELSVAVREIDLDHIIIWQSPYHYIPSFDEISDLMLSNVVYTAHRWWTRKIEEFEIWDAVTLSHMNIQRLVEWRKKYNIPLWLGEFGGPGGGSGFQPYSPDDPFWRICEELLYRCEEQVISWNIWLGKTSPTWDRLSIYVPLFPLKIYNPDLVRQPWTSSVPFISDCIVDAHHIDIKTDYTVELWHNNDYVTLRAGIVIRMLRRRKLADGTFEVVEDKKISVTGPLTLTNTEGTTEYPGDWNVKIFSLGYLPRFPLDPLLEVVIINYLSSL